MSFSRLRSHHRFASVALPLVLAIAALVWVVLGVRDLAGGFGSTYGRRPEAGVPSVHPLVAGADGLALPKKLGSLRFAVMGDVGRGDLAQIETGAEMARWHQRFDFSFVLMLGDNMYGTGTPEDYAARFERPYQALRDAGVEFYAANGNHDPLNILDYAPYNMRGRRYYSFTKTEGPLGPIGARTVRFVAIDTVTVDRVQLDWLRRELGASDDDWEICFFHHPLYTSGRYRMEAARMRRILEPVLVQYGAHIALAGHEHVYERITPQRGVLHFTSGAGGALRVGDLRPSRITAAGFDADTHFVLMEISGDELYFQAISRTGQTLDSGSVERLDRRRPPPSLRK